MVRSLQEDYWRNQKEKNLNDLKNENSLLSTKDFSKGRSCEVITSIDRQSGSPSTHCEYIQRSVYLLNMCFATGKLGGVLREILNFSHKLTNFSLSGRK